MSNPSAAKKAPKLRVFNSFTNQKDEFVPVDPNVVTWYTCGPTVYDDSHMGHARCYVSFDIIRRLMTDYFGYNIKVSNSCFALTCPARDEYYRH